MIFPPLSVIFVKVLGFTYIPLFPSEPYAAAISRGEIPSVIPPRARAERLISL